MIHIPAAFRSSLCLAFLLASAIAHAGPPHIAGVMPAGGMRGTSTTLQVMGKDLNESTALISGKGVLVESVETGGEGAAVKLKIAQDAPLGPRELRLISKNGASNSARIWIDVFPDGQEAEPNEDSAHAQALTQTPIVMNGRLQAATDRDTFSFQARAEEIWVFDCVAARIRSRLDAVLELRDSAGNILKMAQSTWENDPRLSFKFTEDGPYFITIRDTQFYGGPEFVYRLTAGQLPSVEGYIPRGERAGRPLGMEITGVGLPRPRAVVTIPEDASAGAFWTVVDTARGPSLP